MFIVAKVARSIARRGRQAQHGVPVTVLPSGQFRGLAGRAAGFYRTGGVTWLAEYDGQLVIPDDLGYMEKQVFQHEVIHRLVTRCFAVIPTLLTEGLASFFETMLVTRNGVVFGRPPYVITTARGGDRIVNLVIDSQRIRLVPMNILPSLEALFAVPTLWRSHGAADAGPAYAAAWALVHFLAQRGLQLDPGLRGCSIAESPEPAPGDPRRQQ